MSELNALLPKLTVAGDIPLRDRETFVGSAGFEDRKFAAIKLLHHHPKANAIAIIYNPGDPRDDVRGYLAALEARGIAVKPEDRLEYNRFDPHSFADRLTARLVAHATRRVLLDISAMSKLAILLCLDVCMKLRLEVRVHYAEALDYGPRRDEYEAAKAADALQRPSIYIYTGVHAVLRVAQFSSVAMQGQPTAAIAFMSFNEELIQALLDSVYPSRLFLINSRPPALSWREEATAWIHGRLLEEWAEADNPVRDGLPIRTASTLDYHEAFGVLRELYWDLNVDHRLMLAPTGSKMQTLACFLMVALHPDIHIEYPTPEGFLSLYSTGIGKSWLVDFGNLSELLRALLRAEQEEHLLVTDRRTEGTIRAVASYQ